MDQKSGPVASRWNSFADIAIRCAGIAKVLISRDTGHVEFVDRHLSSRLRGESEKKHLDDWKEQNVVA